MSVFMGFYILTVTKSVYGLCETENIVNDCSIKLNLAFLSAVTNLHAVKSSGLSKSIDHFVHSLWIWCL